MFTMNLLTTLNLKALSKLKFTPTVASILHEMAVNKFQTTDKTIANSVTAYSLDNRAEYRYVVRIKRFHPAGRLGNGLQQFWTQTYFIKKVSIKGTMILDLLLYIKNRIDATLTFRRSCREGICGSCAMNINGYNTLACLKELPRFTLIENGQQYWNAIDNVTSIDGTPSMDLELCTTSALRISGLPHARPLRDLVPDISFFYKHYRSISPWLISTARNDVLFKPQTSKSIQPNYENYQSIEDRDNLDGLYECILCLCCNHSCPSYWWNSDVYLGPAVLLQAYRWISDSRDVAGYYRIQLLSEDMKLYSCHAILSCSKTCPKHLNPAGAISAIKELDHMHINYREKYFNDYMREHSDKTPAPMFSFVN